MISCMDKVSTNDLLLWLKYINPNIYSYTCIYMHTYMHKNTSVVFFLNIISDIYDNDNVVGINVIIVYARIFCIGLFNFWGKAKCIPIR